MGQMSLFPDEYPVRWKPADPTEYTYGRTRGSKGGIGPTPADSSIRREAQLANEVGPDDVVRPLVNFRFSQAQERAALGKLSIAAPHEAAGKILQSGQFLSQHDVGDSRGEYDPEERGRDEAKRYGGYGEIQGQKWERTGSHPYVIHGFMARTPDPNNTVISQSEETTHNTYGGSVFRMKPHVLSRTTMTYGDSLWSQYPAEAVSDVVKGEVDPRQFVDTVEHTYHEAQVHGGLKATPEEVDRVDIYANRPISKFEIGQTDTDAGYTSPGRTHSETQQVARQARDAGVPYAIHEPTHRTTQGTFIRRRDEALLDPWDDPAYYFTDSHQHYRTIEYGEKVGGQQVVRDMRRPLSSTQFPQSYHDAGGGWPKDEEESDDTQS